MKYFVNISIILNNNNENKLSIEDFASITNRENKRKSQVNSISNQTVLLSRIRRLWPVISQFAISCYSKEDSYKHEFGFFPQDLKICEN